MGFLLDTMVISELRKAGPNPNVWRWFTAVSSDDLYLSTLSLGEVRRGVERLRPRDPRQARVYDAWLGTLKREYADRILPVTVEVAEEWGRLSHPHAMPTIDGLLAATAIVHDLTFVTQNVRDVRRCAARLLNPYDGVT